MNLIECLRKNHISYELLHHPATFTAQGLAAEEHTSGYSVAKPVLVKADGQFVLCVLPACNRLDLSKVAAAAGAQHAELATEQEMAEVFKDCDLGAEPPVGSMFGLKTLMDSACKLSNHLLFQAGSHTEAVKVAFGDFCRLEHPTIADLSVHVEAGESDG